MEKKSSAATHKAIKSIGILLAAIGVLIGVYAGFLWFSSGARAGTFVHRGLPGNATFNQSRFNQSSFNSTRTGVGFAAGALSYLEGIAIGVLMLLLGIVTFKYAVLKAEVGTKK